MDDQTPERTVLVAAASRHGSTTEIAARIEQTLRQHLSPPWQVEVADLADLRAIDDADALVLGSAVYLGHWLRPAVKALDQVKDTPLLDLWLFSTGPVSDEPAENARVIAADELVESGSAREHMVFAGSLQSSRLAWWERLVVRVVGASSGDRRNWTAVDDWATSIAAQLMASTAPTAPTAPTEPLP
jgi:menaquinone-dependent protoporphyrinogen oxidase|nr:hypothetical protein [Aeromicrobium sp.]